MAGTAKMYAVEDLWRDDIDEMAEAVNKYILDSVDERPEYGPLNSDRYEIESGYWYSFPDAEFDFSLAGPANTDPEILSGSSRRAVFQVEGEGWNRILGSLEETVSIDFRNKNVGDQEIYEIEIFRPF